MPHTPCLLTIAGTDPCGGAGIQVDLQVFRDFGFHGLSVISAVLSQNTQGVQRVDAMGADCVAQQLETLLEDIQPAGIKIGLLPNAEIVEAVSQALNTLRREYLCPVIFDPVLASSSLHELVESGCLAAMRQHLIPQVDLLTPNLNEAELLLETSIQTRSEFEATAGQLLELGCGAVLLKAGHLTPQESAAQTPESADTRRIRDLFADPHGVEILRDLPAIPDDVRGTGCQLSSALLASIVATNASVSSDEQSRDPSGDPSRDKITRAARIAAVEQARAYLNHLLHTRRRNIGSGRPVIVRDQDALL